MLPLVLKTFVLPGPGDTVVYEVDESLFHLSQGVWVDRWTVMIPGAVIQGSLRYCGPKSGVGTSNPAGEIRRVSQRKWHPKR